TNPWPLAGALAGAAPAPPGLPSFSAIVLPWLEYLEAEPGDSAARPAASAQSRRGPLSDVSLVVAPERRAVPVDRQSTSARSQAAAISALSFLGPIMAVCQHRCEGRSGLCG